MRLKRVSRAAGLLVLVFLCCSVLLSSCWGEIMPVSYMSGVVEVVNPTFSGELTVSFLYVGHGDAIFVELPDGETMLIDAGNGLYGNDVINYITARGYDTVDYLVATHPHSDHIGGMDEVLEGLNVGTLYMPKLILGTPAYAKLRKQAQKKAIPLEDAETGTFIVDYDGLRVSVVAPRSTIFNKLNDSSAVIKLVYGDTTFLFMGDAEAEEEEEITANIDADVLKVGHHGAASSTSEEFLERVTPQYAVISAGIDDIYGYPEEETLGRLQDAGAEILCTDELGNIVIVSDGENITVKTGAEIGNALD